MFEYLNLTLATWTGISAIASVLMQLCNSGGHVVAQSKLYGGTHALLNHFLPRTSNITTSFVDIEDLETVKSAMVEGKTNVLYLESISNPTLTVANIPELSRLAHDKGVKVVVDNTFAPMVLSPARLGADVVVQSLTKFISGGSDIIADTRGKKIIPMCNCGLPATVQSVYTVAAQKHTPFNHFLGCPKKTGRCHMAMWCKVRDRKKPKERA
ncbi:Methionine gamma-lyase [Linum perenne]